MANNTSSFACAREALLCVKHMDVLYVHYFANAALNALLAVTAVFGNGLLLAAYYYSPSLRKPIDLIMMSLAATDFLCGATSQPLYIWEKVLMARGCSTGTLLCNVADLEKFCMLFLIGATVFNLSVIAFDRYIVVCHGCKHSELVTKSRVKKCIGAIWGLWLIVAILGTVMRKVGRLIGLMLVVNIIVIAILYLNILREIWRTEANVICCTQKNQEEEKKATERKIAKMLGLIVGLLVLSFVPFIVFGLFSSRWNLYSREILLTYASTAALSNSASNVFIYYWKNEKVRKAMRKVIKKITHRFDEQN